jgi:hypothetical protein
MTGETDCFFTLLVKGIVLFLLFYLTTLSITKL